MQRDEGAERRHGVKMHVTRLVIAPERCGQFLELHGLPDRDPAHDQQDENPDDRGVEGALNRIIGAVPVNGALGVG